MLQKIDLIGNLTKDAEIKQRTDGSEYIQFTVAANETKGDKKNTTYYDVTVSKSGVIEFLKTGQQVFVSGRLSVSATCKDGVAYLNAYVSAKDLILCSSPRK
jgi:single-stranded DNA-binding protein